MNDVVVNGADAGHMGREFETSALLRLIRAAVHGERDPAAVAGPVEVVLDEHPTVGLAWVLGSSWYTLGRLPARSGVRAGAAVHASGGPDAVLRWAAEQVTGPERPLLPSHAEIMVTGAYLAALGRLPDPAGHAAHLEVLHSRGEAAVIATLLASPEADQRVRHPPPAPDLDAILTGAVADLVGLGEGPPRHTLLVAAREGRDATWLVRSALRLRHGQVQGALRRPVVPAMVRACLVLSAAREARELAVRQTAFEWRLHQQMVEELQRFQEADRPGSDRP